MWSRCLFLLSLLFLLSNTLGRAGPTVPSNVGTFTNRVHEDAEEDCRDDGRLSFGQMLGLALAQNIPSFFQAITTLVSMGLQFSMWQQYFDEMTTPGPILNPDCVILAQPCVQESKGPLMPPAPFSYPPSLGMGNPSGPSDGLNSYSRGDSSQRQPPFNPHYSSLDSGGNFSSQSGASSSAGWGGRGEW